MSKIIDFKKMNQKQRLVFIAIIAIILIIITWIFSIFRDNYDVQKNAIVDNYSQIGSYTYFSLQGTTTNDRKIYWDLNDIIASYINSARYQNEENEFSLKNYYDALTAEYKWHLGETGYTNLANNFVNRFKVENEYIVNYKTSNIINEIYELPNNMYLCELNGVNNQKAYIGIILNGSDKTFQIFYIE